MLVLGLGSNIGDRLACLRRAVAEVESAEGLQVIGLSAVYESDALLPEGAPDEWDAPHLNMAVACETTLNEVDLLSTLKSLEKIIGRQAGGRWGPRIIDIDILAWDDKNIENETLIIPHKGLADRPFALWPLADLMPAWRYPKEGVHFNKTAKALASRWGSRFSCEAPLRTRQISASVKQTQLVAAVNLTPDSFSDGGSFFSADDAVNQVKKCLEEGANVIDLGAESTRPGATLISPDEEWVRLEPVLKRLKKECAIPEFSIDTRHVETAEKALAYGMTCLNDVSGFVDPAMVAFAAKHKALDIVVMHNLGMPADKDNVIALEESPVSVVYSWAQMRIAVLVQAGIERSRIIFDVGIGFGKNAQQSLQLIKNIAVFHDLGVRIYVGHSRKSFIESLANVPFKERDLETAVISAHLARQQVHYVRVHNISMNKRALNVLGAIEIMN